MPICVRLEYWPIQGRADLREEIGVAVIGNKTGMDDVSDYNYQIVYNGATFPDGDAIPAFKKDGEIKDHFRKQNYWQLVRRVLDDALPEYIEKAE